VIFLKTLLAAEGLHTALPFIVKIQMSLICGIWDSDGGTKVTVFWDMMQCSLGERHQHFVEICCLHLFIHSYLTTQLQLQRFITSNEMRTQSQKMTKNLEGGGRSISMYYTIPAAPRDRGKSRKISK
jgi:hypothetical protein